MFSLTKQLMCDRLYAIDPGPQRSAIVALVWEQAPLPRIAMAEKWLNADLLDFLWRHESDGSVLVIERIESMGMAVGEEVFETCVWTGRFIEAWDGKWDRVTRRQVKLNLCGVMRAKDSNIRQSLIDRWGGPEAAQKATKGGRVAGPLSMLANDTWSSLAVGVTWRDYQLANGKGTRTDAVV